MIIISGIVCFSSNAQMSDSVFNYYKLKNEAEGYILDSNYSKANQRYKSAFEYKYPNLRDIFHSFIVAYEAKDSLQSQRTFRNLVLHGMTLEKFQMLSFGKTVSEQPFYNWVISNLDLRDSLNHPPVNWGYIKFLNTIFQSDQDFRTGPDKKDLDLMSKKDMENVLGLSTYIKLHGYPSYPEVGMYEASYEGWIQYFSTIWLVMLHTRHLTASLNDQLRKAVNTGEMPPDDYAAVIDLQKQQQVFQSFLKKTIKDDGAIILEIPANEKEIDRKRHEIGLESLAVYKKKLEFQKRDNRFYFVPMYVLAVHFSKLDLSNF